MEKPKEQPLYINEVEGNGDDRNQIISKKENISQIVEAPLVKACEALYNKNIKTLESSANSADVDRGYARIVIDYNSLSKENKQIIDEYFGGHKTDGDNIESAIIKIPVDEKTTIPEFEKNSLELVDKLKKQPLTWTKVFTFEEAAKQITSDAKRCSLEDVKEIFYHDEKSNLFFLSKEHYEKLKEFEEEYKLKTKK